MEWGRCRTSCRVCVLRLLTKPEKESTIKICFFSFLFSYDYDVINGRPIVA